MPDSSYIEPPSRPLSGQQLSFLSIINFVLRNLIVLLVPALIVAAALIVRTESRKQTYTTTATFSAGEEDASPGRFLGLTLPAIIAGKGPQFYVDLITSAAILDPLVNQEFEVAPGKRQTLLEHYGGLTGDTVVRREAAEEKLRENIRSKITVTSGWIIMTVTAETPRLSADIAQAILTEIDVFNSNQRKAQSIADLRFAEERLAEVGVEVRKAEDNLQHFLEANRDITLSPANVIEKDRLTNVVTTRRALYNTILQNYDREKLDSQRDTKLLTIIGPPYAPTGPDPRRWGRVAVIGLFLGAFLGALYALCREYFERIDRTGGQEYGEFRALLSRIFFWSRRPAQG